jgi:hypothetical protein
MRRLLSRGRAIIVAPMPTMSTMLPMHEDMKKRAGKNQQPRQPAEQVRAVFRQEIESRDCKKAIKGDVGSAEPPSWILALIQLVSVCFHCASSDSLNSAITLRCRSNVETVPEGFAPLFAGDDAATKG